MRSEENGMVRVRHTDAGPTVFVPLLGTAWIDRARPYWIRRILVSSSVILAAALAVTLSVLFTRAIDRSGTIPAEIVAGCYALTAIVGVVSGYRWVKRSPAVRRRPGGAVYGPLSVLLFVFMPFLAGMGVTVSLRLFGKHFPGEERAAELTDRLRQRT